MSKIIVFGAGGRAGKTIVTEALRRGHSVTAVVRDPSKHDLEGAVAGDILNAASLAAGHDAAVNAAADLNAAPDVFFPSAARALLKSAVPRLISVGLASVLETADGTRLMDTPGYPDEYRLFCLGHAAGNDVLWGSDADWAILSPSGDFDHTGTPAGAYRVAPADAASRITYADFALAVLDEIDDPKHHRAHIGVEAWVAV